MVIFRITKDGRLSAKDMLGGNDMIQARTRMRELHSQLAEVNEKYGLSGDDITINRAKHNLVTMLTTQANLGATLRQIAACLPNWGAGFQPAAAVCCRYSKHSAAAAGYKPAPQLGR